MYKLLLTAFLSVLAVPAFAQVPQSFDGNTSNQLSQQDEESMQEALLTPLFAQDQASGQSALDQAELRGGGGGIRGGGRGGGGGFGRGGGRGGGGGHWGPGGRGGGGGHWGPGGRGGGHWGPGGRGGIGRGRGGYWGPGGRAGGYGRIPGGWGPHGWWWYGWGPYPGYACYSRDASGYTYWGPDLGEAQAACATQSSYQGCFALGCD